MKLLQKLSLAFTAGVIGAGCLMLVRALIMGMPDSHLLFKQNLYRMLVWGGVWALLLVVPVLKNKWFVRGLLIAFIVIMFNFIVLMPLTGRGLFAAHAGHVVFWSNIGFNTIWGVVAAGWYACGVVGRECR